MDTATDPVVHALKRLTTEVGYILEAPMAGCDTPKLIVSAETQSAFDEAVKTLESIGESISEND